MELKSPEIDNKNAFYTDSIGLMTEKRVSEGKNPARNYYPATTFAYINDSATSKIMSVLLDRGQGVTSLERGNNKTRK